MRSIRIARVSSVIGAVAGLAFASLAVAGQDVKDAAPAAASQEAPELRPGEIVIRNTGKTKRVVTVSRPADALRSQPPAEAARPTRGPAAEDSGDRPGPRSVTIGYTLREPMEMGAGPQMYEGSPYLPNNPYGWNYYGCNTYIPSYGYGGIGYGGYGGGCRTYGYGRGFGYGGGYRSYGSYGGYGSFGGRSSFARPSSAPITYARRAK